MLKLPVIYSDHAVLQQQQPIRVRGWADAGASVTVTFAGTSATATAGADGRWQAALPAQPACATPRELVVRHGRDGTELRVRDVLVGEVWVCSGQSNMQFALAQANNGAAETAAAQFPGIRLFSCANIAVAERQPDVRGAWAACTPASAGTFSAVGYFFGRELWQKLGIPIGLINSSWGGTRAEAWTPRDHLVQDAALRAEVEQYEADLKDFPQRLLEYQTKFKELEAKHYPADPGNQGEARGWAAPETNVKRWPQMPLPGQWQAHGLKFSGVVWFRRDVEVPAAWAGRDLVLRLAPCDKHDTTYFNGTVVGGLGKEFPEAWSMPREYRVPGKLVRAGRNTIASRIYSFVYAGGMLGSPTQMSLALADDAAAAPLPLAGPWRYKVEHEFGIITPLSQMQPMGPGNPAAPYSLYLGMIEPLLPFGVQGAIWYQGESNAGKAHAYRGLMTLLVRGWRQAWRAAGGPVQDFPFLIVQLANYLGRREEPVESAWAELREAQRQMLAEPHTGLAVAIEIGDAQDIHPKNKQDVGHRLAVWALHHTYAQHDVVPSGPLVKDVTREGAAVRVRFAHAAGLRTTDDAAPVGFALAGATRQFAWAEATIEGDAVVLRVKGLRAPRFVRYAWADNPAVNLVNAAALPAVPFQADVPR